MSGIPVLSQAEWQLAVTSGQAKAAQLFCKSEAEQRHLGYFHTLREICQQPWTWLRTCDQMIASHDSLREFTRGIRGLAFTGSGSSEYVGDCVRAPVQKELGIVAESISGGALLLDGAKALPVDRPGLLVSLARSGNSPESVGAVRLLVDSVPDCKYLVVTCNAQGALARAWSGHKNVRVIALPPETNDESLVMTSSFTNLLLAARFLGMLGRPGDYRNLCENLSTIVQDLIRSHFDTIHGVATTDFRRVLFLGSGTKFSAAREAALKMLEMSSGRITTMCETFLSLRHGPMSFVHKDTLVVCQLSSHPTTRAYELDLLAELDRKQLGLSKLIIGENVPESAVRFGDEVIDCPGLAKLGDNEAPAVYVVVCQLLAFFRCLEEGLQPDSPSEGGIINRVVESFPLHSPS